MNARHLIGTVALFMILSIPLLHSLVLLWIALSLILIHCPHTYIGTTCVLFHFVEANFIDGLFGGLVTERYRKWNEGPEAYVRYLGYEFEWHEFVTGDEVTIKMSRIWKGKGNVTGIPVLLQPTLFTNGNVWLTCEPKDCFALLLANCGYDIWILNYRGNLYSPYKRENISYTADDHVREDLPGAIDYILAKTKRKNLHVVSYSKSTTVTFGLLSTKLEYNKKVRIHIAMSPVTYVEHPTVLVKTALTILGYITEPHLIPPLNPNRVIQILDSNFFLKPIHTYPVSTGAHIVANTCPFLLRIFINAIVASVLTLNSVNYDAKHTAMGLRNPLADVVSHHEMHQYGQAICAKQLQSFNYNCVPKKYRRDFPVIPYDVRRITAATLLLEASLECYSQPDDYQRIRSQHQNLLGAYLVKLPNFIHTDGLMGKDKSKIYGRAFVHEMLKFDGDEMQSSCHFDFANESRYLRKMGKEDIAEIPEQHGPLKIIAWLLKFILDRLTEDHCKYFTCAEAMD